MHQFNALIIQKAGSKDWLELINAGKNEYNRNMRVANQPAQQLSVGDVLFHAFSCIHEPRVIKAELEAIFRNQVQNQASSVVVGQTEKGDFIYDPVIQKNLREDANMLIKIACLNTQKMGGCRFDIAALGAVHGVAKKRIGVSRTQTSLY